MMKATINGITVEGTPEEIAEYQKRMDDMRREGVHIKPPLGQHPWWLKKESGWMTMAGAHTTKKCPNLGQPCHCTGACM